MLRSISVWISLYRKCHNDEVACGAVILIVTVVCMMSHESLGVKKKCHEMNICPICTTNEERAYKYTSQEVQIIGYDGSKEGDLFGLL